MNEKTIIVESGRCSWGKCIYCSFSKKPDVSEASYKRLKDNLDYNLSDDSKIDTLKYFNSGSFLDEKQIPKSFRIYLLEKCNKIGVKNLIFECLPEHVNEKVLKELQKSRKTVHVTFALGLEVADDIVLKKINKGFTVDVYKKTAVLLKKYGFGVRTYLMVNLPYVSNIKKSLETSVNLALSLSESIAVINTYPYGYSPLYKLWLDDKWHPLDKKQFDSVCSQYKNNNKIELFFDDFITYPKFPDFLKEKIKGATSRCLNHPNFNVWQEYLERFYKKPTSKEYLLFLPCAFRKPYSRSSSHKKIIERLHGIPNYQKIHQIMISTPGVIPRELETKYPFESYDWPEWEETSAVKKEYTTVTQKRIVDYLSCHKYKKIFCYFKPESESYLALKNACLYLKLPLYSLLDEKMYKEIKDMNKGEKLNSPLTQRRLLDAFSKKLRDMI
ncbi:hypothetical protein GQ473_00710 [archaeon]|nr:hypothetical protein [archaeon]